MAGQEAVTIFEMPIETLRQRIGLAREAIARMGALMRPLLAHALAGLTDGIGDGEPEFDFAATLAQCEAELAQFLELLPGMVLLSPERRQVLQATAPSQEALQQLSVHLPKPPRLTDSAPTALDHAYVRATLAFERSELLHSVAEPMGELLGDLATVLEFIQMRIARAQGEGPPAESMN